MRDQYGSEEDCAVLGGVAGLAEERENPARGAVGVLAESIEAGVTGF